MTTEAKAIDMQDQLIIKEFGIQEITAANIALMEKQILEIPEKPRRWSALELHVYIPEPNCHDQFYYEIKYVS